jgi:hypothetical protein
MALALTLCAAYVAYCLGTLPPGPLTTPDSVHYLNATPIVPLGYPLFLKILGARGAMIVQPLLFGGALAFLATQVRRHTGSTALASLVVLGTIALPQIRAFHASILSESLFLSLLVVFLGFAVRFAYQPSWHLMVLVATAAGLSVTVRRTGVALLPVMLMMVLLERHRLKGAQRVRFAPLAHPSTSLGMTLSLSKGQGKPPLFFVAALAPFLVIIGAEQAVAPIVHAGQSSSLMGRHMFAKAALIDAPAADSSSDPIRSALDRHLETDYAPIRAFLAAAPGDLRGVLSMYYETCLQGGCADRSRDLMKDESEARQTSTMGAAGLARIRRAPLAFLQLTMMNYQALWTADRLRHPDRAPALNAFIASHRPMPFERLAFALRPEDGLAFTPSPRVRYMQIALTALAFGTGGLAMASLIGLVAPGRLPTPWVIAAVGALVAHFGLLLTASLAAGFARFTIGLWPAIVVSALFGWWAVSHRPDGGHHIGADATAR